MSSARIGARKLIHYFSVMLLNKSGKLIELENYSSIIEVHNVIYLPSHEGGIERR